MELLSCGAFLGVGSRPKRGLQDYGYVHCHRSYTRPRARVGRDLPDPAGGMRYAFVGDLVWQLEGLLEREPRPWFESKQLREDPDAFRQSLRRLAAIAERYPQITMVPSHDRRGYAFIPEIYGAALR